MSNYGNIKEQVAELAAKRDRTGLPPLSNDERIQLLNEIYDGLLYLWKQSVIIGNAKGTGALCLQIERARLEIEVRSGKNTAQQSERDPWGLDGFALPEYDETLTNN